jgi:ribosome-binding factor A
MTRYRAARVGELLQIEIAHLLARQMKDPRLSMATISRVEVSADLRHACVYVSRIGSEAEQQAAIQDRLLFRALSMRLVLFAVSWANSWHCAILLNLLLN